MVRSTWAPWALGAAVALAAWFAIGVANPSGATSQAALAPQQTPVIMVHGYANGACPGANIHHNVWGGLWLKLAWAGWSSPSLLPVSYYQCDTNGVDITGYGPTAPAGATSAETAGYPRAGYTQAAGIDQIAHDLAWFVYDTYSSAGTPVDLVGGSMGGLIVRYALYRVQAQDPAFPPYLIVPRAATISTPHTGLGTLAAPSSACGGVSHECQQMATDAPFITDLIANGANPQGLGGTAWTIIGSSAGCDIVPTSSSLAMPTAHRIDYLSPCYTHIGYAWDFSSNTDATVRDMQPLAAAVTNPAAAHSLQAVVNAMLLADAGGARPSEPVNVTAHPVVGSAVTLTWDPPTNDGGSAITGYDVYRSSTLGSPGVKVATVTTPSWTSGALSAGTYYFEVTASNAYRGGPASSQISTSPDHTAPSVSITSPSSPFQLDSTVTVAYSGSDADSGVASYDVEYRTAAWNGAFGAYTTLASGTSATSASITGTPGREYCFHVRALDNAGNLSGWTPDACTAVPLDDRAISATTAGWGRYTGTAYYRGTATATGTAGATLQLANVQADRLALVVTTCSTCGTIGIYLDGVLWQNVNTASATTSYQVIELPGGFTSRTATVVLKNAVAGKQVIVDGLGIADS